MKGVVRLLAMTVLIVMVSAVALPVLAESWDTWYGTNNISVGANIDSTYIRRVQNDLCTAGFSTPVTGVYSRDTAADVRDFQSACGLTANGIVNAATKRALWNASH